MSRHHVIRLSLPPPLPSSLSLTHLPRQAGRQKDLQKIDPAALHLGGKLTWHTAS
uniref:Uncharacterized protein n=1 Tax=Oryza sativa subsp. japonica TaxID=39947 RepID=Q8LIR2_ORYSJ|nr:hypothetical protein [Oryza sativa Japonica Group]